ncbi:FFLEELY motif protein [Propionivibrio sp.]|uniref:FFLEELY motif protein n=1 Tax=Propionivibrio sp. TaxID=2212460 RepID=UPI003BF3A71F
MDNSGLKDEKLACTEALRQHLQTAKRLRRQANAAPATARQRLFLREWQAGRLAHTYADLLASERFGQAAQFFLSDLYGPKDFSSRDEEVERILPLLISLLPFSALQTLSLAIEVDALSELLDAAMVVELERAGSIEHIDEAAYAAAYRCVGRRPERERQIMLIRNTGKALEKLSRKTLLNTLLKLMRGPTHLAGLGDLQAFLENGFAAFRHMGDASEFLDCIESRERRLFTNLFSGAAQPFA